MLAQSAKKKRQQEAKSTTTGNETPKAKPSSLEQFFENLAEKLEPKEPDMPSWPAGYEKPDYMQEQKEFETAKTEDSAPPPVPAPAVMIQDILEAAPEIPRVSMKAAVKSIPSALSKSMISIPSTPIFRSKAGSGKGYTVSLRKKSVVMKLLEDL